jgi:suppressor for copper-sensitivity B
MSLLKLTLLSLLGAILLNASPLYSDTSQPIKFQLLSSTEGAGEEKILLVGLSFHLEPGWKTYSPASGSSGGYAPKIHWKGSSNIATIEDFWPQGVSLSSPDGSEFKGYKDKETAVLKIHVLQPGLPVHLSLQIDALACGNLCVPVAQSLSLEIPAGPSIPTQEGTYLQDLYTTLTESKAIPFWQIVLLSLLGGLILNLMPCVLPVLSLKLMMVVDDRGRHKDQQKKAFLWTFSGILTSFLGLGILTATLKEAGMKVGWGAHFQNPFFLGFMGVLMLGFALNLLGIFEIGLPQWIGKVAEKNHGPKKEVSHLSDFMAGIMATLLATPCSAPFLGTAVGYALIQGPFHILVIFMSLGLGFGFPYLVGGLLPSHWIRLPSPGAWMLWIRRLLGLGMLGSALWFLSALGPHLKEESAPAFVSGGEGMKDLPWQAFDPLTIPTLVDKGHVIFLDVTADWCLTCHYNKKAVLATKPLIKAFQKKKVILMRADWTKADPTIHAFMERHHRYGVPLNVVFGPLHKSGIVLPELLSQDTVLKALKDAGLE